MGSGAPAGWSFGEVCELRKKMFYIFYLADIILFYDVIPCLLPAADAWMFFSSLDKRQGEKCSIDTSKGCVLHFWGKRRQERFAFEKGKMRDGGTAPSGRRWRENVFFHETLVRMV